MKTVIIVLKKRPFADVAHVRTSGWIRSIENLARMLSWELAANVLIPAPRSSCGLCLHEVMIMKNMDIIVERLRNMDEDKRKYYISKLSDLLLWALTCESKRRYVKQDTN